MDHSSDKDRFVEDKQVYFQYMALPIRIVRHIAMTKRVDVVRANVPFLISIELSINTDSSSIISKCTMLSYILH